jgi:argininosuccinate synthase
VKLSTPFFSKVNEVVTGSVTLILYKGNLAVQKPQVSQSAACGPAGSLMKLWKGGSKKTRILFLKK